MVWCLWLVSTLWLWRGFDCGWVWDAWLDCDLLVFVSESGFLWQFDLWVLGMLVGAGWLVVGGLVGLRGCGWFVCDGWLVYFEFLV